MDFVRSADLEKKGGRKCSTVQRFICTGCRDGGGSENPWGRGASRNLEGIIFHLLVEIGLIDPLTPGSAIPVKDTLKKSIPNKVSE